MRLRKPEDGAQPRRGNLGVGRCAHLRNVVGERNPTGGRFAIKPQSSAVSQMFSDSLFGVFREDLDRTGAPGHLNSRELTNEYSSEYEW
jgi:hypothetical protein